MSEKIISYRHATIDELLEKTKSVSLNNDILEKETEIQKDIWNTILKEMFDMISTDNHHDLINVQPLILSNRQKLINDLHKNLQSLSKRRSRISILKGDRAEFYSTNFGQKLTLHQIKEYMDRDFAEHNRMIQNMELFIEFLRDCRMQCDNLSYAVKNRIDLINYMS